MLSNLIGDAIKYDLELSLNLAGFIHRMEIVLATIIGSWVADAASDVPAPMIGMSLSMYLAVYAVLLAAALGKPLHRCAVCGATNISHPERSFRYCSKCAGTPCYCEEHLRDHAHLVDNM